MSNNILTFAILHPWLGSRDTCPPGNCSEPLLRQEFASLEVQLPVSSPLYAHKPVTVALGTWHSAISPLILGCKATMMALVPESTIA